MSDKTKEGWVLTDKHPVFKLGMTADSIIFIAKKTGRKLTKPPVRAGKNSYGDIVKYYYEAVRVTFNRVEKPGPYVASKIEVLSTASFL